MSNWDEADHPREPAGKDTGGQFTKAESAARAAAGLPPKGIKNGYNTNPIKYWAVTKDGKISVIGKDDTHEDLALRLGLRNADAFAVRGVYAEIVEPRRLGQPNGRSYGNALLFYRLSADSDEFFMRSMFKLMDKFNMPDDPLIYVTEDLVSFERWDQ